MTPVLRPGTIVIAHSTGKPRVGRVVLLQHDGLEKLKRITKMTTNGVYVLGDNAVASTDSRQFGTIPHDAIRGVVIWPLRALRKPKSRATPAR